MVILTVVAGWLVYQNYLKPRYQLADLLPTDYQISLEYKQDHFALPKLQQEKILNNPVLKKIHDILWDRFTQELKKFNDQAQNLLTKTEHLIIFYQDPKTPGLLLDLPPKLTAEAVEKIEFVGWQNDLASFYKTANVFVQTSFFEGYGLSLIEAGLYGLPIITTPVGIAQELEHGKDAFIYPVGNPELFAQGVVDLIENNYKRENLRTNMKHTLDIKLISRADYLAQIKDDWASIATNIK